MDQDYDKLKAEVLLLAAEDMTGLWEAWQQANGLFPSWPLSGRLSLAERVIADLLGAGLIRLYRGSWTGNDQAEVPAGEVAAVLREWSSWVATHNEQLVFFLATAAGSRRAGLPQER